MGAPGDVSVARPPRSAEDSPSSASSEPSEIGARVLCVELEELPLPRGNGRLMLPLTPRMSALLLLARREAELLGHSECGAEHVLLAALWEGDGVAAQAIQGLDASDAVRGMLLERMRSAGYQPGEVSAVQLMDKAAAEAKRRGDTYIGTEHVLLAMTRSGDVVGSALDDLGISRALRDRTQNLLEHS